MEKSDGTASISHDSLLSALPNNVTESTPASAGQTIARSTKREDILQAAKHLFARSGYHFTGISDIIKRAGIARGTFYLYFKSKKAVFDELVEDVLFRVIDSAKPVIPGEPPDMDAVIRQVRINIAHALGALLSDRNLAKLLVSQAEGLDHDTENKLREFYGALTDWLAESLTEGQELGIVRPGNSRLMAIAAIGMLRGMIWAWAVGEEDIDIHEAVEELAAIAVEGILMRSRGGIQ